jgi:subtilisin family serine protease
LSRRARRGHETAPAFADLPLHEPYVAAVGARVTRVRNSSRWLNALSVEATPAQVEALAALPFVARLDVVRRYRRPSEEPVVPIARSTRLGVSPGATRAGGIDYGTSLGQLAQVRVPEAHALGLHGEGVVVAVLDAGFNNLGHEALVGAAILAQRDFVNGDEDVSDGPDLGEGSHGTATLSTLGGYREGELVGPAFAASFILAKTENTESETPVEEDHWAAAAEWAEALGADVISSSLGYLAFDSPFTSYTPADMDGATAVTTRASELAAERGVVVVNSAGNAGYDPTHNTLGAPADGRRVVAVGAVGPEGIRVAFSSVGPSSDGRIKPDVAAQGFRVKVALPSSATGYGLASGTSFSCPLTAGVVALVLQAHPDYTVDQVLAVLRGTASQARLPDNLLGFGIVNAVAAVSAPPPAAVAP